jgi:hypothetical protein
MIQQEPVVQEPGGRGGSNTAVPKPNHLKPIVVVHVPENI